MQRYFKGLFFSIVCAGMLSSVGCSKEEDVTATQAPANPGTEAPEAFIRAEPEMNAVLERPPRSLRIYLSELPNIERSSLKLFGPNGEVTLRGFHTMGANDLMIEIEDHPLANGEYTVEWMARFGDEETMHTGSYQFTVAVPSESETNTQP